MQNVPRSGFPSPVSRITSLFVSYLVLVCWFKWYPVVFSQHWQNHVGRHVDVGEILALVN